jgi:hypothetical protein
VKLIMEGWRSFINEAPDPRIKAAVEDVLEEPAYEKYVAELGSGADDPRVQAVLRAGLQDGNPRDESVGVSAGGGPCTQFLPIQNEIDLSKSLGFIAARPANVPKVLAGGPISAADMGGSPIISAANQYIVDGHHRWSQVYMINPDAVIETMDIKISDPETALRAMQAAIAVVQKRVPSQKVAKGLNVFAMSDEAMVKWMRGNFTPDFIKLFVANSEATDAKGVIEQILFNIHLMKENNSPVTDISRGYMPQTGNAETIDSELRALSRGIVNFKEPAE